MLELKHISKKFQERIIIDDLSITFQDTGFVGIKGESGSGKSTLLYIIGMLDQDYEGDILYNHEHITKPKKFIRQHISYMMQNKDFIEALNVKENILLAVKVSEKSYDRSSFHKIIHQLGIQDLLGRYPHQLSGGQLKRISIAKALLKQSSILLCDEPTGALHLAQAHEVMQILKKVAQKRLVIIVSHDDELLKQYCDSVLTLQNGKLNGEVKTNALSDDIELKKQKTPLWFYPLKQCILQKYKLIFLMIFQWIVIVAFFLIVTALNGVWSEIQFDENHAVNKSLMSIEKKDGQSFKDMIHHPLIQDVDYTYQLTGFQVFCQSRTIESDIHFLPIDISHIVLKQGRLPVDAQEVLVSSHLYNEIKNHSLQLKGPEFQKEFKVVGVIDEGMFVKNTIYCHKNLKHEIPFCKDEYSLIVEATHGKERQLYQMLNQSYFVYSDVIERIDNYQSLLELAKMVALLFIAVSFFISLLLIGIVESIIYLERKHDTAYLLSLGLSHRRLYCLTILEAMFVGVLMAGGGSCLSALLYYFINDVLIVKNYVFFKLKLPVIFFSSFDLYIIMILSYLIMAVIGVMRPMKKMIKMNIIDILREE